MINTNNYNDIEQKDLLALTMYLNQLVEEREKMVLKSIVNKDVMAFKSALSHNKDKVLSKRAWQTINFGDMKEEHLDFFICISQLPDYKENDISNNNRLNKTDTAMYAALHDEKLFDYFIEKPEYLKSIKHVVSEYGLSPQIPKNNIEKLFNKSLLNLNKGLMNEIIFDNRTNYLEYLLENKLIKLSKEQLKDIYMQNWNNANDQFISLLCNNFSEYKEIKLFELINKLDRPRGRPNGRSEMYEKYKSFTKLEDGIFIRTIKNHPMTIDDVRTLTASFNTLSPEQDEKFHKFINLVVEQSKECMIAVKEHSDVINTQFKEEYIKAINYIDLNIDLDKQETLAPKKLKI